MSWIPILIALILAVLLIVVIKNPKIFKTKPKRQKDQNQNDEDNSINTYSDDEDKSLTDKFLELTAGDFVSFGLNPFSPSGERDWELKVKGIFYCLNHNGPNFWRNGGEYPFFGFGKDVFFIKRPDGWYGFNQAIILQGDEADGAFKQAGEDFSKTGQIPGSISLFWRGKSYPVNDVGYLEYQGLRKTSHLDIGDKIKFMIFKEETDPNVVYFLENIKRKDATDRVCVGMYLGMDLDSHIVDIFPKNR
ncbi:MAG: hypothetical protein PHX34_01200 [Candidatus Shapirobacteria bacterium]|nr:hypothetical protein [Candidatus Shapirobacteria bacterium]